MNSTGSIEIWITRSFELRQNRSILESVRGAIVATDPTIADTHIVILHKDLIVFLDDNEVFVRIATRSTHDANKILRAMADKKVFEYSADVTVRIRSQILIPSEYEGGKKG